MRGFENRFLDGLSGKAMLDTWHAQVDVTTNHFAKADPKKRLKWAGPDMSARSSITARLMETWAHGQEIYDHLGLERLDKDRIRNIAHLGVSTFGWTFGARGRQPPGPVPHVRLTAPSGATWEWNESNTQDRVSGNASEFCQVVTQTRNIEDTKLCVSGDIAREWMSIAQCFAGPPETPPPAGSRRREQTF